VFSVIGRLFSFVRRADSVIRFANHFERFARFEPDSTVRGLPARLLTRFFFTRRLACLMRHREAQVARVRLLRSDAVLAVDST